LHHFGKAKCLEKRAFVAVQMYLVRTPIQPARHAIRRVIRVITLEEVFAREEMV